MVLKIVMILAVILALTIGAHLLFYKAIIGLFVVSSPGLKISLFSII